MFDLHTHTIFSDGTTTPEENAALASEAGLTGLALTDHDTADGWDRMRSACRERGLAFVPGIELSTELDDSGSSVHIIGYWPDASHPELAGECARLRHERHRRAEAIVERLGVLGIELDWVRVEELAAGAPLGRPHIGAAMVEAGVVADLDAAFDEFLADGGPAWVPKHALAPARGVELIRAAGGVAVLAHPGATFPLTGGLDVLDDLTTVGLAGVEADHPSHDDEVAAWWRAVAAERELLVTGCSDFHGGRKEVRIGERTTSSEVVRDLRERADGALEEQEDMAW